MKQNNSYSWNGTVWVSEMIGEKTIILDNGKWMIQMYGKYQPQVSCIFPVNIEKSRKVLYRDIKNYPNKGYTKEAVESMSDMNRFYMSEQEEFEVQDIEIEKQWSQECHAKDFNLEGREMTCMRGKYWNSKKGTNCFEVDPKGPHVFVCEDWGQGHDRGDIQKEEGMLYFHRASSNGGGTGYTYAVLPVGWKKSYTQEEI